MNSNLSLLILAGGLGSRYNGSKQLDVFGPQQAFLLEFAMYDAVKAGFSRIILVVNPSVIERMTEKLAPWKNRVEVIFVLQTLRESDKILVKSGRTKPWGTAQAVLSAKEAITGPFVVMNADDYYGHSVMQQALDFFSSEKKRHGLIAYPIGQTLSPNGGVSRGICDINSDHTLHSIEEQHALREMNDGVSSGQGKTILPDTLVSMNFWLFQPFILSELEAYFDDFFKDHAQSEHAECYLPSAVQFAINEKKIEVNVLRGMEQWVGLTFPADRSIVEAHLKELTMQEKYPKSFGDE